MPQNFSNQKSTRVQVLPEAITWANADSHLCCYMLSPGHIELMGYAEDCVIVVTKCMCFNNGMMRNYCLVMKYHISTFTISNVPCGIGTSFACTNTQWLTANGITLQTIKVASHFTYILQSYITGTKQSHYWSSASEATTENMS